MRGYPLKLPCYVRLMPVKNPDSYYYQNSYPVYYAVEWLQGGLLLHVGVSDAKRDSVTATYRVISWEELQDTIIVVEYQARIVP